MVLEERFKTLKYTDDNFGFLLYVTKLIYDDELVDLKTKCKQMEDFYKDDVNGDNLYENIINCRMLLASRTKQLTNPMDVLEFILEYDDESLFPNLRIAIQISLTIAISTASSERSFSKLKLILSYVRANMSQHRLVNLALLSIEKKEWVERFQSSNRRLWNDKSTEGSILVNLINLNRGIQGASYLASYFYSYFSKK